MSLQVPEEKLKPAMGTNPLIIFVTQLEAISKFYTITTTRKTILVIARVGNQHPPPLRPTRYSATALANNIIQRFGYFKYYSNVL
jgi:hypothetical protein